MGESTNIEWTDHTFNAFWGCTKVSPGCDNCYAETFDKRVGGKHWGKGAPRRVFGERHWREPMRWNAAAEKGGQRRRVFCSSMADVFDAEAPVGELKRLWALIRETPHLDWQLLTKRHGRIARSLPPDWGDGYPNVWLGVTVEDQARLDERLPALLSVPARMHFLSCEPLLGRINPYFFEMAAVGWIIVGGESGHRARPFDLNWARILIHYGREIRTPIFVKQLGSLPISDVTDEEGARWQLPLADRKGGDPREWPVDLRVREFPEVPAQ
jgi:protein gp37